MDKFHGINRADITSTSHFYEIVGRGLPKYSCVPRTAAEKDVCNDFAKNAGENAHCARFDTKAMSDTVGNLAQAGRVGARDGRAWTDKDKPFDDVLRDEFAAGCDGHYFAKSEVAKTDNGLDCDADTMIKRKGRSGAFTVFRYGLCAAVLLVCLLGRFTSFAPLKEASGFIKDELNRDSIIELYDANAE